MFIYVYRTCNTKVGYVMTCCSEQGPYLKPPSCMGSLCLVRLNKKVCRLVGIFLSAPEVINRV